MHDTTSRHDLPRHVRRSQRLAYTAAAAAAALALTFPAVSSAAPRSHAAAERSATASTFNRVFHAARGGSTINLASGDYGTFSGGSKSAPVTIKPAPGASVRMGVNFNHARNIHLEHLAIDGAQIFGSRNITIAHSRFTDVALIKSDGVTDANVVLRGDRFDGLNLPPRAYNGRLSVIGSNEHSPVGVQIRNSHFGNGGCSDGVFVGGDPYGLKIGPGNEFSGVRQGSCNTHVDSIQLYGSTHTRIVGNFLHDDDTMIMAPDGGDREYIADNVFVGDGRYRPAIQLGSHSSTAFVHNTVKDIDVFMDAKPGNEPSTNGQLLDNLMVDAAFHTPGSRCVRCSVSFNLFSRRSQADGSHAIVRRPRFVGGGRPRSYSGFALAARSPGRGDASDGANRGARIHGSRARPKAPKRHVHHRVAALRAPGHVSVARLRHGLHVRVSTRRRAHVTLRLRPKGSRHVVAARGRTVRKGAHGFVLRPRVARLRHRHVRALRLTVTVKPRGHRAVHLARTVRLRH